MIEQCEPCRILVLGAGPAGLACGIEAAKTFHDGVIVLERNREPGKKLRLAGSGQCNLTHGGAVETFLDRFGGLVKGRFVKPSLFFFDNSAMIRFFEQRGVPLWEREDGKVFPRSMQGSDILRTLTDEFTQNGGVLQTETRVRYVEEIDGGFRVETDQGAIRTEKLVIATGGKSYPATGSEGDGFRIAEELGHRIVPPRVALTPVYVRNYPFAGSSGISFDAVPIEHCRNGKKLRTVSGDVLLTHRGVSGPGILDMSRWIEPKDILKISFVKNRPDLTSLLTGKKTLKNSLAPLGIPERFLIQFLESQDVFPDKPASETPKEIRKRLESLFYDGFPFEVEQLGGWNEAMATAGGVSLEEVDRQTMQSRLVPGLFFCGEVLDIDGDTGGYNIQFALSSGFLAGDQITKYF